MRQGSRLGVDVGEVRVGVAASDPAGLLATPVETVRPAETDPFERLSDLVAQHEAVEVLVGLPRSLSGREGPAAQKARDFAEELVRVLGLRSLRTLAGEPVAVRLVDERLSTVTAEATLRQQGRKGARRRQVVDQAAAVVILQSALDTERGTGRPPGERVLEPGSTDIDKGEQ